MPNEHFKERRKNTECPCTTVVELGAVTRGQFDLINLQLQTMQKNMDQYSSSFAEIKQTIVECVSGLQEGSNLLKDGSGRFDRIEKDIEEHKTGKLGQHEKIGKTFLKVWLGVGIITGTLILTGHINELFTMCFKVLHLV